MNLPLNVTQNELADAVDIRQRIRPVYNFKAGLEK